MVCAVSGVATASASASEPEYWVWPNSILQSPGGEVTLEAAGSKFSVRCKSSQANWELTTFKSGFAHPAFKECKSNLGTSCKSTNTSVPGEITTKLSWKLVYLSKATHEVGTLFQGTEAMGGWTTFSCGAGTSSTLRGSAVARTTPVNVKAGTFTMALQGTHGIQEFTQYETEGGGKATAALEMSSNAGAFGAASINASLSQIWQSQNEIRAIG
jgi:hypothetical protein